MRETSRVQARTGLADAGNEGGRKAADPLGSKRFVYRKGDAESAGLYQYDLNTGALRFKHLLPPGSEGFPK